MTDDDKNFIYKKTFMVVWKLQFQHYVTGN